MYWGSCVTILVRLLLLNVLAAEAFIGNNKSWNSRDLNFRRPLLVDSKPNPIVQPIHTVSRPLPEPVEIQKESSVEPADGEIVPEKSLPEEAVYEQPTARYYQTPPQRFNLQRRPIAAPQPAPIASLPTATAPPPAAITSVPVTISTEPAIFDAEVIKIAPEITVPVSTEKVLVPSPSEEPVSAEDIEVFPPHASPAPSSSTSPLNKYLMARPLPRPTDTVTPIRSVTIMREEPEHEKKIELTLPTSSIAETSSRDPIDSNPSEIPTVIASSTPIMPKYSQPEEPGIEEIEKSEPVISEEPIKVTIEAEPAVVELSATPILGRSSWRKTLPVTRKPAWQPITQKPVPASPPARTIHRPKPSQAKPSIPSRVTAKPAPVPTPIPLKIPTIQPSQGRFIPTSRGIPEPTQLMDYACDQENVYHDIPNDCDSYVECKAFIPMMKTCPDGLHFNRFAVWPDYPCAYPSEVQCEGNAIMRHDPQPTEMCPRQYGLFPLPDEDCGRYLICQEGIATVMDCPPGLVFNTVTNTCDWPANVPSCTPDVFRGFTCPAPPLEEDGTPSDMIFKFRFGQSCKEYIACQLGHPRLLSCDPGLFFDEESEVCVDSEYVQNCRP